MASTATYIAEWFRQRLSSAVTFQKQFVDDVTEKVKEQKAQFDRHTREANDRAIQLHLDGLEEKYLCCVCGRGGEAREDDEFVYDTYSMVELPSRTTLEAAVREELADAEMSDERIKQHQRELAVRQRGSSQASMPAAAAATRYSDDDGDTDDDNASFASGSSATSRQSAPNKKRPRHPKKKKESLVQQRHGSRSGRRPRESSRGEAPSRRHGGTADVSAGADSSLSVSPNVSAHHGRPQTGPGENRPGELAVMDPDMVGPLEVRNTLYKIRHAVLHKESRTRRKAVAVHKDKGLMKIEESEIDMFSHFFQRPVHGYLCSACYTCARRRLDTLTQQIRGILYKAQNPILRRVPSKEVEALSSSNQVPLTLVHSIIRVQRRWARLSEKERLLLRGAEATGAAAQTPTAALISEEQTSWNTQINGETVVMGSLPEKCVLLLREEAKCGACQRRQACFFEQKSVVFLCQFCTARDRFYRENAVCINDEAMPLNLVHMLQDFASYYQALHQQMELRGAPQSAIVQAQTDLFPLTEVMRDPEGLFACLAPAATAAAANNQQVVLKEEAPPSGAAAEGETRTVEVSIASPSTFAATNRISGSSGVAAPLGEQRERVGRTMVSLFDGIVVESAGLDLFSAAKGGQNAAAALAPANSNTVDLFQAVAAPAPGPATSPTPVFPVPSVVAQEAGTATKMANGITRAPAGQVGSPTPPPNGASSSDTPNPDWDSLF